MPSVLEFCTSALNHPRASDGVLERPALSGGDQYSWLYLWRLQRKESDYSVASSAPSDWSVLTMTRDAKTAAI